MPHPHPCAAHYRFLAAPRCCKSELTSSAGSSAVAIEQKRLTVELPRTFNLRAPASCMIAARATVKLL
jgi:hypothetical protein